MRVPFSEADVTKFFSQHSKLLTGVMLFPGSLSVSIPGCPCVFFTVDHVKCHILCFQGQDNSRENGLWIQFGWWLWTLQVTGYAEQRMVDWGLRLSGQSAYLAYTKPWIHSHMQRVLCQSWALSSAGRFAYLMINHDKLGLRKPCFQSPLHIPGIVGHTCNSVGGSRKSVRSRSLSAT